MIRQYINSIKNILESAEPMDSFKLQFKALQMIGVMRDPSTNKFLKFLSIFPVFLILKFSSTSCMYILSNDVALEDKVRGSFTGITSVLCVIKMYYIHKHQQKLVEVVKLLKSRINDMTEEETKTLQKEAIYPTASSYLVLQSAIILSCIIYWFFPVGTDTYNNPLPVFAWYPKYMNNGIPYKAVYILQEMSIVCVGTLWVCIDTINFGLLAHHYVMLKILSQRIASLGWIGIDKRTGLDVDHYEQLCEHVEYHLEISRYQNDSSQIYSSIFFAKVTFSVVIICSFVYAFGVATGDNYLGLIAQFVILNVIVSTLFVLSWMSEKISVTSNELLNKAAEANFQGMDRKTTKALILFMQGLSPTVVIEVGTAIKVRLNLKMFVTIMDFAYKCLALLKTAV